MLTTVGRITRCPSDRQGVPIVSPNGLKSRQTELANHRSGDFDIGERTALLLGARELRYFASDPGQKGLPSGKCRVG